MDILFVDTETGGLNPVEHSLLQVGMVAQRDGKTTGTLMFYIQRETYSVTERAMKINGLNLDDVRREGVTTQGALKIIKEFVKENFGNHKPIMAGHNPSIDKYMLRHQIFEENGEDMDETISHRLIDTMSIIWALRMAGKLPEKACSSTGAFEHFGINVVNRHDALDDCIATASLLKKLIEIAGR